MTHAILICTSILAFLGCGSESTTEPDVVDPVEDVPQAPLETGKSFFINHFSPERLANLKAAGIDHLEVAAMSI